MSLKAAVGWSVVFHLFLLAVQPPQGFVPAASESPIKVTYIKIRPPPALVPPKPAPKPPRQETSPRPVVVAAASGGRTTSNLQVVAAASGSRTTSDLQVAPAAPPVENRPVTVRDAVPGSSSSISNLPEGEFAALQHKQQVRRHLNARLAFPSDGIQGSVRLRLILAPNGTLQDLVLLEASDSRLGEMALEGARSAEPYPPFPPQMKKSHLLYEYIIQYRLE